MSRLLWIDELYAAFCMTLPDLLREEASGLACTLGLAPSRAVPWSQVFGHEVTLAAPALVAEAMPHVPTSIVMDAVLAHMLAVIEAFGTDRIEDRQVGGTGALLDLLEHARRARDAALRRVAPGVLDPAVDGRRADAETIAAIVAERETLVGGRAVGLDEYEAVSIGKQAVGFPASMALAHAAGWDASRRAALWKALACVWLGLQFHDDVVDWEEDFARGGAWAVSLAKGVAPSPGRARAGDTKTLVLSSGVLARILSRSRRRFGGARRRAHVLGAHRLAAWAQHREDSVEVLAMSEAGSAGFAGRAHALAAWAREVLA